MVFDNMDLIFRPVNERLNSGEHIIKKKVVEMYLNLNKLKSSLYSQKFLSFALPLFCNYIGPMQYHCQL